MPKTDPIALNIHAGRSVTELPSQLLEGSSTPKKVKVIVVSGV